MNPFKKSIRSQVIKVINKKIDEVEKKYEDTLVQLSQEREKKIEEAVHQYDISKAQAFEESVTKLINMFIND